MSGIQNYTTSNVETSNQGIVDGRAAGQQPTGAPVTLDTYVDRDASSSDPRMYTAHTELPGATSKDVHASMGQPGSGMTSTELRHNGQGGRKREGLGLEQRFGGGAADDVEA